MSHWETVTPPGQSITCSLQAQLLMKSPLSVRVCVCMRDWQTAEREEAGAGNFLGEIVAVCSLPNEKGIAERYLNTIQMEKSNNKLKIKNMRQTLHYL